jgi:hypothetical protein
MMLLSAEQYFETRRKHIDKHVEGEHAWFGITDDTLPAQVTYNDKPLPWYVNIVDCN